MNCKLQWFSLDDIVHFPVDWQCDICRCFVWNDMFGWQIHHSKRKLESLDEKLTDLGDYFNCLLAFAEEHERYPIRTHDTGKVVLRKYSQAHAIFWCWVFFDDAALVCHHRGRDRTRWCEDLVLLGMHPHKCAGKKNQSMTLGFLTDSWVSQ